MEELSYCSTKTINFDENFVPSDKPHKGCNYSKIIYKYAEIDEQNDKIKIVVEMRCPHCGKSKNENYFLWRDNNEMNRQLYLRKSVE